jgi:hypothetical protein
MNLYGEKRTTYRNDHALSIALGMVNGHVTNHNSIPWNLATVLPGPKLTRLDEDVYQLNYLLADRNPKYITVAQQDFHVLGKFQLGEMIADSQ